VLAAVELALEAGAPTKTHILNVLHRLIDGKPIDPPAVKPPNVSTPEQDCIAFRSKDASMMPTRMPSSRACLVGVRLGSDRLWACRRCCGVSAACSD
jgi:hypothetical protein